MEYIFLSTNDFWSVIFKGECLLWNNDTATLIYMLSVVNQFRNTCTIQDNKNTFVQLILIYYFIVRLISIIPTDKRPYCRHVCLLSYLTIQYPQISSRMLGRPSEKSFCANRVNRMVGLLYSNTRNKIN